MKSFKNYIEESVWVDRKDTSSSSRDNIKKAKKAISQGMPRHKAQAKYLVKSSDLQKKTPPSYGDLLKYGRNNEATYQGKKVTLNKPMPGDVKKSKVYVDPDGDGKAKKVNFGDKNMTIKKDIPARRKSFRARHNCDNPGPKDKARYWSCKAW